MGNTGNWVYTDERLPKRSDADGNGHVITCDENGSTDFNKYQNAKDFEAWMCVKPPAKRDRWRKATIQDLVDAGCKPVNCRYRDDKDDDWKEGLLAAVSVDKRDEQPYLIGLDQEGVWYAFCEVKIS